MIIDPDAAELAALGGLPVVHVTTTRLPDGSPVIPAIGALAVMRHLSLIYPDAPFAEVEEMADSLTTGALAFARAIGSVGCRTEDHGVVVEVHIDPIVKHSPETWHDADTATVAACVTCSNTYPVRSW